MDPQICPRCKSSTQRNRHLKLLVNVCGHTLCENCVDLLFLKGSGSCPECKVPLRRNNFRVQLFEDSMVEKEIDIRRRLLRDYNKKEEDFNSLEEFNDYLEEIEVIIYNLCNNVDIIETNKRIENYKRENRDLIQRNKARLGREEIELEELLAKERALTKERQEELEQFELEQKKIKTRENEAFIDKLMYSSGDAKDIVEEFAEKKEKLREVEKVLPVAKPVTEFSTGIKVTQGLDQMFLPVPKTIEGPLYEYQTPTMNTDGPAPPTIHEIENQGYLQRIRSETSQDRAGGYYSTLACQRALQEALQGLFHGAPVS